MLFSSTRLSGNGTGGGGGGSPTIGLPVIGGDPNDVLFVDSLGNLGQDDSFQYDAASETFQVGFSADGSLGLVINPTGHGQYGIGDLNGIYNSTYFYINDIGFRTGVFGVTGSSPDVPPNSTFPSGTPGFVGTGPNDMEWNGYNTSAGSISYLVNVDSVANAEVDYTGLVGTFMVGETVTVTAGSGIGSTGTITFDNGSSAMLITNEVDVGTGFSNPGDTITGSTSLATAQTNAYVQNPDTFSWTGTDGGSGSMVQMDTSPMMLENNVFVFFGSITGHVLGDQWSWDFTATFGGTEMVLDGANYSWGMGDLDGLVKAQSFGITQNGSPDQWQYDIQDENGSYFHLAPIDAPSSGQYWFGNQPNVYGRGTYFSIQDRIQFVDIFTDYGSHAQTRLFSIRGQVGHVAIGDINGAVNGSTWQVQDNNQEIIGNITLSSTGDSAQFIMGETDISNTADTLFGIFSSITNNLNGNQGVIGIGESFVYGSGTDTVFMENTDPSGDFAAMSLSNTTGTPLVAFGASSTGFPAGYMVMEMTPTKFGVANNLYGGTIISADSTSINPTVSLGDISIVGKGTYFEVNDAGQEFDMFTNLLSGAGRMFTAFNYNSGYPFAVIGDVDGMANGTSLVIDDFNESINLSSSNVQVVYLGGSGSGFVAVDNMGNLSFSSGTSGLAIGDTIVSATPNTVLFADASGNLQDAGATHTSQLTLNDSSQFLEFSSGGFTYLNVDANVGTYILGDVGGSMNSTFLSINDAAQTTLFSGYHVSTFYGGMLSLNGNTGVFEMGDLNAIGNGTQLVVDDGNQRIAANANLLVQLEAEEIYLKGGMVVNNQYATPTTGATVTIANTTRVLVINPSGALLALTIAFPTPLADGQIISFNCTQVVSTLTLSGGTFVGGLTSLAAGGGATYVYSSGDSSWHYQP